MTCRPPPIHRPRAPRRPRSARRNCAHISRAFCRRSSAIIRALAACRGGPRATSLGDGPGSPLRHRTRFLRSNARPMGVFLEAPRSGASNGVPWQRTNPSDPISAACCSGWSRRCARGPADGASPDPADRCLQVAGHSRFRARKTGIVPLGAAFILTSAALSPIATALDGLFERGSAARFRTSRAAAQGPS